MGGWAGVRREHRSSSHWMVLPHVRCAAGPSSPPGVSLVPRDGRRSLPQTAGERLAWAGVGLKRAGLQREPDGAQGGCSGGRHPRARGGACAAGGGERIRGYDYMKSACADWRGRARCGSAAAQRAVLPFPPRSGGEGPGVGPGERVPSTGAGVPATRAKPFSLPTQFVAEGPGMGGGRRTEGACPLRTDFGRTPTSPRGFWGRWASNASPEGALARGGATGRLFLPSPCAVCAGRGRGRGPLLSSPTG